MKKKNLVFLHAAESIEPKRLSSEGDLNDPWTAKAILSALSSRRKLFDGMYCILPFTNYPGRVRCVSP
jgi:hypothetical protein